MGGCGEPWQKHRMGCPICGEWHQTTVHQSMVQCKAWREPFSELWTSSWGPWEDHARQASKEDRHHGAYPTPFLKVSLQNAFYFYDNGWHATNTTCRLGPMPSEANCRSHPARNHAHVRVGHCPHGMANCVTHRSDLIRIRFLWEQVLYKPRPKQKKAVHTPTTLQQIHHKTSLLLARPLTKQTILRILQITDSPDYQLCVHAPQRHGLIGHLLAPIFGVQREQALRDGGASLIAQGNQSLCARHISVCFAQGSLLRRSGPFAYLIPQSAPWHRPILGQCNTSSGSALDKIQLERIREVISQYPSRNIMGMPPPPKDLTKTDPLLPPATSSPQALPSEKLLALGQTGQ